MKKVKPEKSMGNLKMIASLALVGLAGAAIGILFAPYKGIKTRERIADGMLDMADDLITKMKDEAKDLLSKAAELEDVAITSMDNVSGMMRKKAKEISYM